MTEPHAAPYGHPEIPAAVWTEYRHEDWYAARNVAVLMTAIFLVGVVLYLGVAYMVAESPNYFPPTPAQAAAHTPAAH